MIDSYKFGGIVIDGVAYSVDVIVFPDRVRSGWWREVGHSLSVKDLGEVLDFKPDILVVGTGQSGMMKIPEKTRNAIASHGIEFLAMNTGEAVKTFNDRVGGEKVVGAFHLTC